MAQSKKTNIKNSYTFIDLFAGCGGLTEGFYKAGFKALAHVEIDHLCCETLKKRMRHYGYSAKVADSATIETDITRDDINDVIDQQVNGQVVDLIVGGPPCQAYSTSGRARDEHGMKLDPRNYLFENYVKVLNHFRPKVFVFENVTGLLTATINGKKIVEKVFEALGENYNVTRDPKLIVFNTANYGVPQIRKRVIIIGTRRDLNLDVEEIYRSLKKTHYDPEMPESKRKGLLPFVTVRDAIGDLPSVIAGARTMELPYTPVIDTDIKKWLCYEGEEQIKAHITRWQNPTDTVRYQEMARNGWTFAELRQHRPDLNHDHARVFSNSYTVQFWDMPARTIIAHLCKDGNQFIHPDDTQGRSISVREAARLQSFPDDFEFAGAMSSQFKQIGNAVPPLFAYVIAERLKSVLKENIL
ncbi:MAG: DNA cytosine methyltransferase [Bacteroidales bacterium]|nr:DNA cytosine methyltransferase [Bacteroidales bacterium]